MIGRLIYGYINKQPIQIKNEKLFLHVSSKSFISFDIYAFSRNTFASSRERSSCDATDCSSWKNLRMLTPSGFGVSSMTIGVSSMTIPISFERQSLALYISYLHSCSVAGSRGMHPSGNFVEPSTLYPPPATLVCNGVPPVGVHNYLPNGHFGLSATGGLRACELRIHPSGYAAPPSTPGLPPAGRPSLCSSISLSSVSALVLLCPLLLSSPI